MENSSLYDQNTFYGQFERDLRRARHEVIIESPFITTRRMAALLPTLAKLRLRGVMVIINTKDPVEHDGDYCRQALEAVSMMQEMGILVLYTIGHHRKLAIIDSEVFYEGSLNILSFSDSCEIMRRVVSSVQAEQLIDFIEMKNYVDR